jgi:DNA-binding transcriptional regulator YiaG
VGAEARSREGQDGKPTYGKILLRNDRTRIVVFSAHTPEAHEMIEDTKARHMGLLLPAQFKELRERYDFSQKEMGELFQVGEKSWTRWESGKHRPSRSINLLIRALYEGKIPVNYLLKQAGKRG